MYVQKYDMIY